MPAWTVAVSETSSISTISSIADTSITMPPAAGTAAPITPEPPPRGTTGTRFAVASLSVAATSSSLAARTTASGSFGAPCRSAYSAGHDQSLRAARPLAGVRRDAGDLPREVVEERGGCGRLRHGCLSERVLRRARCMSAPEKSNVIL